MRHPVLTEITGTRSSQIEKPRTASSLSQIAALHWVQCRTFRAWRTTKLNGGRRLFRRLRQQEGSWRPLQECDEFTELGQLRLARAVKPRLQFFARHTDFLGHGVR